jgi:tetratricopeptide (TPR) repeat protein
MSAGNVNELLQRAAKLHGEGRRGEAIEIFQQVLATQPQSSEGWYELGYLFKAEGRYSEALDAYGEALGRGVNRPEEVHLNRAVIYSDHLRRDDEAERELQAALKCNSNYVPAILNLGNLHEERGQRDQALNCYDRVIEKDGQTSSDYPDLRLEALARAANLRPPLSIDDPLLQQLHDASVRAARHSQVVRANLLFALGRAYDKLGAFDQAFDAYAMGNRCLLRDAGRTYDRAHAVLLTDAMIGTFHTATARDGLAPAGATAEPLFICGMFRSGSTLVEQVLAAHPQVTAGGELDYLMRLAASRLAPFPQSMAAVDPSRDAVLADEYLTHLANLFPEAAAGKYITDKRPDNFLLIGLIKRLFPNARIVHSTRHPLDNGLSIFMQHLNPRVAGYASNLGDIGHHFGQYRRLMNHWKSLYPESIYDFDYDAFVSNPRVALDGLFKFLGIEWDDRCLQFHQLDNTVKTASYWQVRKPLYSSASGRWRHYLPHLAPLRAALVAAGIAEDELV